MYVYIYIYADWIAAGGGEGAGGRVAALLPLPLSRPWTLNPTPRTLNQEVGSVPAIQAALARVRQYKHQST